MKKTKIFSKVFVMFLAVCLVAITVPTNFVFQATAQEKIFTDDFSNGQNGWVWREGYDSWSDGSVSDNAYKIKGVNARGHFYARRPMSEAAINQTVSIECKSEDILSQGSYPMVYARISDDDGFGTVTDGKPDYTSIPGNNYFAFVTSGGKLYIGKKILGSGQYSTHLNNNKAVDLNENPYTVDNTTKYPCTKLELKVWGINPTHLTASFYGINGETETLLAKLSTTDNEEVLQKAGSAGFYGPTATQNSYMSFDNFYYKSSDCVYLEDNFEAGLNGNVWVNKSINVISSVKDTLTIQSANGNMAKSLLYVDCNDFNQKISIDFATAQLDDGTTRPILYGRVNNSSTDYFNAYYFLPNHHSNYLFIYTSVAGTAQQIQRLDLPKMDNKTIYDSYTNIRIEANITGDGYKNTIVVKMYNIKADGKLECVYQSEPIIDDTAELLSGGGFGVNANGTVTINKINYGSTDNHTEKVVSNDFGTLLMYDDFDIANYKEPTLNGWIRPSCYNESTQSHTIVDDKLVISGTGENNNRGLYRLLADDISNQYQSVVIEFPNSEALANDTDRPIIVLRAQEDSTDRTYKGYCVFITKDSSIHIQAGSFSSVKQFKTNVDNYSSFVGENSDYVSLRMQATVYGGDKVKFKVSLWGIDANGAVEKVFTGYASDDNATYTQPGLCGISLGQNSATYDNIAIYTTAAGDVNADTNIDILDLVRLYNGFVDEATGETLDKYGKALDSDDNITDEDFAILRTMLLTK